MEIKKLNSLVELYFKKYEEIKDKKGRFFLLLQLNNIIY